MLVAVGAALSDDQVTSLGNLGEVESILAELERRGVLHTDERRRCRGPTEELTRLDAALDVVETADHMLRELLSITKDGRLTLDDLDAVLGITRWAARRAQRQPRSAST